MISERLDTPHSMLLPATQDELARELFCRSVTNFLELQARPPLRQVYAARVEPPLRAGLGPPGHCEGDAPAAGTACLVLTENPCAENVVSRQR
jgi:hypothetical protein